MQDSLLVNIASRSYVMTNKGKPILPLLWLGPCDAPITSSDKIPGGV